MPQRIDIGDGGPPVEFPDSMSDADILKAIKVLRAPKYDGSEYGTAADSGSGAGNFLAGMGKSFVDVGRAIGQPLGLVDQPDIEASRRRDAPLMDTGAGLTGNILGMAAMLAPTSALPGANTIVGAGLYGAGTGALMTPGTIGERAGAAGAGAAGNVGGLLAGRLASGALQGGKALFEPVTLSGRDRIAARTLQRFAGNADDAARAAGNAAEFVPGSAPTLAEATGDAGLAQLQRGLMASDPQTAAALAQREIANRAARGGVLTSIGKDDAALEAAMQARKAITGPMYDAAMDAPMRLDDVKLKEIAKILNKDSAKSAWENAVRLASEDGISLGDAIEITPRHLQYLKLGLDDALDAAPTTGLGKHAKGAVQKTRSELVGWLQDVIPEYRAADNMYAGMSKPIDQMKVGQYLSEKLGPALNDFGATNETPAMFARELRNSTKAARNATGFGRRELSDILSPKQMKAVEGVAKDLARAQNISAGRGVGSNTAQNLASQNLLRRTLGPLGMPESWMEGSILPALMGPARLAQFAYNAMPEQKIQQLLADAVLDPKLAATLLKTAIEEKPGLLARGLLSASPPLGQATAYGLLQ
jgi:hypothetical protein